MIILTIQAEMDNAMKVLNDVVPGLADYDSRGRPRGAPNNQGNGASSDQIDLRLLVHQSHAGCIIGKGGGKVKELREKTGARIKIYTNCCPQSTDRVVQLSGGAQTCCDCVKEILELLETQGSTKGVDTPYDPLNYDDYYAEEYGGFGVGGGQGYGPGGPPGAMGRNGPMGASRGFSGAPRDITARGIGGGRAPAGFGGYDNFGNGMVGDALQPAVANGGPQTSTSFSIPKDLAGAIIGKAGARIRRIRTDSGAGIIIDEPKDGSNDRLITITGLPHQVEMAHQMLQQSMAENSGPPPRY
ncbi:heterogeneous nuclear ribonucleoprotein K isoform X2 [Bemisia tabaci]|uniref:heterogeneous nuclear ribonucleoprotein K isoform X2 n=1 Tax=Bemisia tabaci TaxID=7038 RepID=UPI0008F98EAF|nr:PREDICTED: heterogeneous nuclear ribonucleoprotein K isoform X2 [Bemisia tabaci]